MVIKWEEAPEWANYWCITQQGQGWWLETEWELNMGRGGWSNYKELSEMGQSMMADNYGYTGDWKASMTKRPQ